MTYSLTSHDESQETKQWVNEPEDEAGQDAGAVVVRQLSVITCLL